MSTKLEEILERLDEVEGDIRGHGDRVPESRHIYVSADFGILGQCEFDYEVDFEDDFDNMDDMIPQNCADTLIEVIQDLRALNSSGVGELSEGGDESLLLSPLEQIASLMARAERDGQPQVKAFLDEAYRSAQSSWEAGDGGELLDKADEADEADSRQPWPGSGQTSMYSYGAKLFGVTFRPPPGYEFAEFREPMNGEVFLYSTGNVVLSQIDSWNTPYWILRKRPGFRPYEATPGGTHVPAESEVGIEV